jgi:preprotein translocase subunit SecG
METVLLVIHLMLVAALIGLVLVQRSEGGALGIGGGGANFMASRSSGNVLTRATTILAAGFFATSIALTILARVNNEGGGIFDNLPANEVIEGGEERPAGGGVLELLGGGAAVEEPAPAVPDEAGGGAPAAEDGPVVPNDAGAPAEIPGGEAPPAVPEGAGPAAPPASP